MGCADGDSGTDDEGQDVKDGLPERDVDDFPDKVVPYGQPEDVEKNVCNDHGLYTVRVEEEHDAGLQQAEADGAPHEDVAAALADEIIRVERRDGDKCAADAEYLHEVGTLHPLVRNEDGDELRRDERQAEEGRAGDKGREAEHLAERTDLPLAVVFESGEYGLCHVPKCAVEECIA